MGDNTVSTYTEGAVGHLLVRRDPAASISLRAELRKGTVEALGECGQHHVGVEVSDTLLGGVGRFHQRVPISTVPLL